MARLKWSPAGPPRLRLPHDNSRLGGRQAQNPIQERAREARYALLSESCGGDRCRLHFMTAHHADDQAETIFFRSAARKRNFWTLRDGKFMQTQRRLTASRISALCSTFARRKLIAVCEARGHPFLATLQQEFGFCPNTDTAPSPLLAEDGLDRQALLRLGRRAARADVALDARVAAVRATLQADRAHACFRRQWIARKRAGDCAPRDRARTRRSVHGCPCGSIGSKTLSPVCGPRCKAPCLGKVRLPAWPLRLITRAF